MFEDEIRMDKVQSTVPGMHCGYGKVPVGNLK